jgi:hypothetical protein
VGKKDLILNECEIDGCKESVGLHLHHVIERTDINCSNNTWNLAILCSNCHSKIHLGLIKVIGIYPSTKLPNGRTLVYEINGKGNVDGIKDPYATFKNKSYKI